MIFKSFVLVLALSASCHAGGSWGGKGGHGGGGGGGGGSVPDTINAPVISKHIFKLKPVPSSSSNADIPTIIIGAGNTALKIQMQSASSDVQVEQQHDNSGPQVLNSNSVDGGIVLNQYVKKPILQNVREVIIPERKIVQEVLPVKEFIKTIVAQEQATSAPTEAPTTAAPPPPPPKKHYRKKMMMTTAAPATEAPTTTEAPAPGTSTDGGSDDLHWYRR